MLGNCRLHCLLDGFLTIFTSIFGITIKTNIVRVLNAKTQINYSELNLDKVIKILCVNLLDMCRDDNALLMATILQPPSEF